MDQLNETLDELRLRRRNLAGLTFSLTKGDGSVCAFEFVGGGEQSTILKMNGEEFIYWSGVAPEFRVMVALVERGFSDADIWLFWEAAHEASPNFARWAT